MKWLTGTIFTSARHVARATVFPMDMAASKRRFVLIYIVRLFFLVGRRVWQDNCPRQASALAYQTMLSLVPMLAVMVSFATWLNLGEYQTHLTNFAAAHLMPAAAEAVTDYILEAGSGVRIRALGMMGAVGLVAMAVMLLLTIEQSVNEIFRCPRQRPIWKRLVGALLLLSLGPFAVGLSIYLTGRLVIIPGLFSAIKPLVISIAALFIFYWTVPNTKIQFKYAFVAAFATGVLLEALKAGFAFYVTHLGSTLSYLYGTFAILPLAMVWIYLTWLIFLFGSELNAALHEVQHYGRFERRV